MRPERDLWDPGADLTVEQAARVCAAGRAVYERFLREQIEERNFCPYARPSRLERTSVVEVVFERLDPSGQIAPGSQLAAVVGRWIDTPSMEVVQVLFPRLGVDAQRFERWAKATTAQLRGGRPGGAVWAVAAFHPDAAFGTRTAAELVTLFRRSPDPMMQWVRLDALDRLRLGRPEGDVVLPVDPRRVAALIASAQKAPLHERVAENNLKTVERLGVEAVERSLRELADEARLAYETIEAASDA